MKQKAVGFYWTLPVPWAGFTQLADDIDEAAQQSRTIRYQRDMIRRYAKGEGFDLIREQVFLEFAPDRGSEFILEPLEKLGEFCRREDATLLLMDFEGLSRPRGRFLMEEWFRGNNIRYEAVNQLQTLIDGQWFDPYDHFAQWRKRQEDWTSGKPERIANARVRATQLQGSGLVYGKIAETLNSEELRSATGKPWTSEMVRKLLSTTQ